MEKQEVPLGAVKVEYPPNYHLIERAFPISDKKPVFAYSPYIYNPHNIKIDEPLFLHEAIHLKQQGDNPQKWWDLYMTDAKFRLSQEMEATQKQYKLYCTVIKDRNKRFVYLNRLAMEMSSELYGKMIAYTDAKRQIQLG